LVQVLACLVIFGAAVKRERWGRRLILIEDPDAFLHE
jgi:hypothetical protein